MEPKPRWRQFHRPHQSARQRQVLELLHRRHRNRHRRVERVGRNFQDVDEARASGHRDRVAREGHALRLARGRLDRHPDQRRHSELGGSLFALDGGGNGRLTRPDPGDQALGGHRGDRLVGRAPGRRLATHGVAVLILHGRGEACGILHRESRRGRRHDDRGDHRERRRRRRRRGSTHRLASTAGHQPPEEWAQHREEDRAQPVPVALGHGVLAGGDPMLASASEGRRGSGTT